MDKEWNYFSWNKVLILLENEFLFCRNCSQVVWIFIELMNYFLWQNLSLIIQFSIFLPLQFSIFSFVFFCHCFVRSPNCEAEIPSYFKGRLSYSILLLFFSQKFVVSFCESIISVEPIFFIVVKLYFVGRNCVFFACQSRAIVFHCFRMCPFMCLKCLRSLTICLDQLNIFASLRCFLTIKELFEDFL